MDEKIELENQNIEVELFIQMLFLKYGYDFRNYSKAHMKRRINYRLKKENNIKSISELTEKALRDKTFFEKIITDFSINVTQMYRDPLFYKALRTQIIPILKTYPFVKVWHAGCSTGEEVYSMAIMLQEEGLYDKVQIYATDFNEIVLNKARDGVYSTENLKEYNENYKESGGKYDLSKYYNEKYDNIIFDQSLKKKIVFSNHNLVIDGVFGEMNLIICRNVLIYFNKQLQDKVITLFRDSLYRRGILGLGSKESLDFSVCAMDFKKINEAQKIYKKNVL